MQKDQSIKKLFSMIIGGLFFLLVLLALLVLPDMQVDSINDILLHFPGLDKLVHFFEHFFLVLGMYFVMTKIGKEYSHSIRLAAAFSCSIFFSIIDETHQTYIAGRSFELADLASNTFGSIAGITVISYHRLKPAIWILSILSLLLSITYITYESFTKEKHFKIGMRLEKESKFRQARKQYVLALEAGNKNAALYNSIAWLDLEFLDGDPSKALKFAQKAVSLRNDNPNYLDTLGRALLDNGRVQDALIILVKAYEMNPDIYSINLHLGSAYYSLGELDNAMLHFKQQVQINPDDRFGLKAKVALGKIENTSEYELKK